MSKEEILEVFFNQVQDALEWGVEKPNQGYFANYIDGMSAITKEFLNIVDKKKINHNI